jgi:ribosomal protein L27
MAANAPSSTEQIPQGEKKILAALIQYPQGLERNQLTVLTGYKRSSRDSYIQRLGQKGYVEIGAKITATADGIAALPDYEPLPTGYDLQTYWQQRLPAGEWAILEQLLDAYPNAVDRDTLSDKTGYKRSSRDSYIQRLGARQLVTSNSNGVTASATLF